MNSEALVAKMASVEELLRDKYEELRTLDPTIKTKPENNRP